MAQKKRGLKSEKPWRHMQPNVQNRQLFSIKRARGLKRPMKTMKWVRQDVEQNATLPGPRFPISMDLRS